MKKYLSIFLSLAMLLSLCACGSTPSAPETTPTMMTEGQSESSAPTDAEPTDDGFISVDEETGPVMDFSDYEEDRYHTSRVPAGQQKPVEPGSVEIDTSAEKTCYLAIYCDTILDNMDLLTPGKEKLVPADGVILGKTKVTFYEGESVFDVLQRETRSRKIHMEASFTPMYNSAYIEGIHNLYEFDCGGESGWMYCVNGWFPNYGVSRYQVQPGDVVELRYTCDLGRDVGDQYWDTVG